MLPVSELCRANTYPAEVHEHRDGGNGKTAEETAGPVLIPQPHGGALLSGGVPGNAGGGRKTTDFIAWCQEMIDNESARRVFFARLQAGDLEVLKLAAAYAKGKPTERLEVMGKVAILVGVGKLGVEADDPDAA